MSAEMRKPSKLLVLVMEKAGAQSVFIHVEMMAKAYIEIKLMPG